MKNNVCIFFTALFLCFVFSCTKRSIKADTSIDYGNSPVSGVWRLTADNSTTYDVPNTNIGGGNATFNSEIDTVVINSNTHMATFTINHIVQAPESYTYGTIGDTTFISFSPTDPFRRTANIHVAVTRQTDTSMVWIAKDPKLYQFQGPPGYPPPPLVYYAYVVTFDKK